MKSITLFEGVERIGKTTLLNKMRQARPGLVLNPLKSIRDLIKVHNAMGSQVLFPLIQDLNKKLVKKISAYSGQCIYIDRWYVSQFVYQYSYKKGTFDMNFPMKLVLYILLGPDEIEFYVKSNTKELSQRAYFCNKLFLNVVETYKNSKHRCEVVEDIPVKNGVTLYRITH